MSAASNRAVADRLTTLRNVFARQVPVQLEQIRALHAQVLLQHWQQPSVERLLARLHDFTGAAATFGFTALGEASRNAERAVREQFGLLSQAGSGEPDDQQQFAIGQLIQHLLSQPKPDTAQLPGLATTPTDAPLLPHAIDSGEHLIYVVDDNALVAEQISIQLRHLGYTVNTYFTLREFEAGYRAELPSAIVLDIEFPGEDSTGPATIGRLMHELDHSTPIIFISGHENIQARLAAARAGGSRYLLKPVVLSDLIDALDSLLHPLAQNPSKILIVDDSVAISQLYAGILESAGMKTQVVNNPLRVLEAMAEFHPDLVLIDLYMPECSGHEVAMVIRQVEAYIGLPIVFLSSESDRNKQLSALRIGADDFLTKPVLPNHLIAAVENRVERSRHLRALLKRDNLTGLLNHSALLEAAAVELARTRRVKTPLTLAMIDLDNFKTINQHYGHTTGDRLLRSLGHQLKQRLRTVDLVGRYGGEEFVILFSATDAQAALNVVNSIREDFAQLIHAAGNGSFSATFSAGLASFSDFQDLPKLLEAADRALYEAKRQGRNLAVLTRSLPLQS